MTRKMTVGAAAAAFFGTILAASATDGAGVAWNAEFTNTWFVADMSSVASPWAPPASGTASALAGAVVFETEVGDPLRYVPADPSGPVALVNVQMVVDPNAATPPTDGLEYAQAALSVVTNNEGYLEWIGLTKVSEQLKWEKLYGDNPTSGSTYDVQIAVDNHGNAKKIRYAVKGAGAFTVLTNSSGNAWLDNPQTSATSVTNVAFAGAGTIKSLGGSNVVGKVVVDSFSDSVTGGYDFTNGTVTAVVDISGSGVGMLAQLEVKNTSGTTVKTITGQEITSESVAFDLTGLNGGSSLDAGATYTYVFSIDYGDGIYEPTKSGTFVAANWSSDWLFGAKFVNGVQAVTNGTWHGATTGVEKWEVVTNAQFVVDEPSAGAGAVTRVDTSYLFESFIDTDSLETLENAVGGIVAASDGEGPAWYAYTGTNPSELNGWQKLTGDIVPATNTDYVIRAEFDFKSSTHKVCYYVAEGNSGTFCPLTLGVNMMIDLASQSQTALSSVEMLGKGSVKSICAKIADASVAKIGDDKYGSLWEAVKAGGTITLLTNATLTPGATGGRYQFRIANAGDFSYESLLTGTWKIVQDGEGNLYLVKPAATYIFF